MFGDELDSYIAHRILIVDKDPDERGRLNRAVADLRGVAPDTDLQDAGVTSLIAAREYIQTRTPSAIIIDPEVSAISEVLSFIQEERTAHPTIIWVINSKPHWWAENQRIVDEHPFGERVKKYYRRTKTTDAKRAESSFLVALAQCQSDFVLQLIDKAATEIRTEIGANMTDEQVRKFVTKAMRPLLSLLAKDFNRPRHSNRLAFVSMPFTSEYTSRYSLVIAPTLISAGYEPRMMEDQFRNQLIPVAILGDIAQSSLFVADITEQRPDIMIEAGAALMIKVPVIFVARHDPADDLKLPFMIRNVRVELYKSDGDLQQKLKTAILNPRVPFFDA